MNIIDTNITKLNIDEDFKIEAGPGAGKTCFLVKHIGNVLSNSKKLSANTSRKIAAITYTNVAVDVMKTRLGSGDLERVDVSTLHSFLYNNIVKPYGGFLEKDYHLKISKVDGHYEPFTSEKYIREWMQSDEFKKLKNPFTVNQIAKLPNSMATVKKCLREAKCVVDKGKVRWKLHEAIDYTLEPTVKLKGANLEILEKSYLDYKKRYWENGVLDHEDILFFASVLIDRYPFILNILKAKYPYVFVDEFQDTNEIQFNIVKQMRKEGCIVGVIGDKAQAIYGFQGADINLFEDYKISKANIYTINENHRSDKAIVDFLNKLRKDINQKSFSNNNRKVEVIVGNRNEAFKMTEKECNKETLVSLSRDNITANKMKQLFDDIYVSDRFCKEFSRDSDKDRKRCILSFLEAVELAKNSNIKEAIKKIDWYYRDTDNPEKSSLKILSILLTGCNKYETKNLIEFYSIINDNIEFKISKPSRGKPKKIYETIKYNELAISVNIEKDNSNHITIHKSKGVGYENVFVIGNKEMINFLLQPDLEKEEHRIYYVAASRAKKRLYLQLDTLTEQERKNIKDKYNIEIRNI